MEYPYSKQFPSVALFADISGFTNLTEKLSALPGTLGVEVLADEINNYLSQIIKQIVGAGGDIFKFAGDALLCVWPPSEDEVNDTVKSYKNLSLKLLRVIRCAVCFNVLDFHIFTVYSLGYSVRYSLGCSLRYSLYISLSLFLPVGYPAVFR